MNSAVKSVPSSVARGFPGVERLQVFRLSFQGGTRLARRGVGDDAAAGRLLTRSDAAGIGGMLCEKREGGAQKCDGKQTFHKENILA